MDLSLLTSVSLIVAQASIPTRGLIWIDWMIVLGYLIGTLWLGWYLGRGQSDVREYFVGSGRMNYVLIGISLFASLLSTISYLSMPGEAIGKGPVWMATFIGYPIVFLIVGFGLLPVYMRQTVTSAYELLEARLGRGIRRLGATLFILLRLVWMSTLVYFAASALSVIFGISPKWEPLIVALTGLVAVVYTSLGGLRAVVITDCLQTILLYLGALGVIAIVTMKLGLSWFPTQWHPHWDHQPIISWDPSVRLTVVGVVVSRVIWQVCTMGGDQVSVQRFMATHDAVAARRSLAVNLLVGTVVLTTLFLAGFALLAYYEANPEHLGSTLSLALDADKVFPHFIAHGLPPVVSGLVVSALLAAAMSSFDSGVNSITAVVFTDFISTPNETNATHEAAKRRQFRHARWLALVIGLVVIATSGAVKYVPGNISAITGKTVNLLTVPIFCLFFFALFVKRATPVGALCGCVAGTISAVCIAFSGPIFGYLASTGTDPVSFIWMPPGALVVNLVVGWIACRLLPTGDSMKARGARYLPIVVALCFVVWLSTAGRPSRHIRLNKTDRQHCLEVLRSGLRSDQFWPSMHAAEGLTLSGRSSEVRQYLTPRLKEDLDDRQRCGVARELARAGDLRQLQVLVRMLRKSEDFAHVHAAESLYKVGHGEPFPELRAAQDHSDALPLKLMAAAALAKGQDQASLRLIRDHLNTDDLDAIRLSAWILGRIGSRQDIAPIRAHLATELPPDIRAMLEHALAALGDQRGLAALKANLSDADPQIRTYAATFAGDARDVAAAPMLKSMLEDPNLDTRIRAAQSLLDLSNRFPDAVTEDVD